MAGAAAAQPEPYRAFAGELGLLFQIVDDMLDEGTDGAPATWPRSAWSGPASCPGVARAGVELLAAAPGDTQSWPA